MAGRVRDGTQEKKNALLGHDVLSFYSQNLCILRSFFPRLPANVDRVHPEFNRAHCMCGIKITDGIAQTQQNHRLFTAAESEKTFWHLSDM